MTCQHCPFLAWTSHMHQSYPHLYQGYHPGLMRGIGQTDSKLAAQWPGNGDEGALCNWHAAQGLLSSQCINGSGDCCTCKCKTYQFDFATDFGRPRHACEWPSARDCISGKTKTAYTCIDGRQCNTFWLRVSCVALQSTFSSWRSRFCHPQVNQSANDRWA